MKAFLAAVLIAVSTIAVADEPSYMVKYVRDTHSITVWQLKEGEWVKANYLVDEHNKVIGTNKTVEEFINSVGK